MHSQERRTELDLALETAPPRERVPFRDELPEEAAWQKPPN
jgi:hypothetical protein